MEIRHKIIRNNNPGWKGNGGLNLCNCTTDERGRINNRSISVERSYQRYTNKVPLLVTTIYISYIYI